MLSGDGPAKQLLVAQVLRPVHPHVHPAALTDNLDLPLPDPTVERTLTGTPPARFHTFTGLDNGTEYTVRVRATTALGDSDWSDEAKGTPREGPHVSLVKVKEPVSCTVSWIALEFANLDKATEYHAHLRFRAQGSSNWTVLWPQGFWSSGVPSGAARGELNGPSPAFTLTDLAYETTYEVQAALDGGFVDGLATTTFSTPNLSEVGLMPLSPGDGTLGLRMTRPASEGQVAGYLVQWKSGDEEYDETDTSERQADVPGSGDREYTITGLDNGVGVPPIDTKGTPEAPPNSPARGAPTISGTAQVGETLTAHTDGIEDDAGLADAVYSYQWLADGADISGATGETYTPAYDDERKVISVKVSFIDDRDFEETLTSEPTEEVAEDPDAPTEPPNAPRTVLHAHVPAATGHLGDVAVGHPRALGQLPHAHAPLTGTLPDVAALAGHHDALAVDDPLPGNLSQGRHGLLAHLGRPLPAPRRNLRQVAHTHAHPGRKLLHGEPAPPGRSPELGLRRRLLRSSSSSRHHCRRHRSVLLRMCCVAFDLRPLAGKEEGPPRTRRPFELGMCCESRRPRRQRRWGLVTERRTRNRLSSSPTLSTLGTVVWMSVTCIDASFALPTRAGHPWRRSFVMGWSTLDALRPRSDAGRGRRSGGERGRSSAQGRFAGNRLPGELL